MTDNIVRPAQAADIPAITAIYDEAVRFGTASFELTPPDEAEMLRRFEAIIAGGHVYLVCTNGETLLGYAYASAYRPRPAYRWTVENSVYVAKDGRRRGVGRALLARLIADCEARDFRQMVAVIGDSANAGSIGLHAALGFEMTGTLKNVGRKFDRWLDTVIMQRALGAGAETPPQS